MEQLHKNLSILTQKLQLLDDLTAKFQKLLEIPDEIEAKLGELDNLVASVDRVLLLISIIPAINTEVKAIEKIVKSSQDLIHSSKIKVENLDNKYIEPIREQITDFRSRLQHLIQDINKLKEIQDLPAPELNPIIEEIIKLIAELETPLQDIVNSQLFKISQDTEQFLSQLHFIDIMISPVNTALKEKITVPYSFKVKVKVPKTKKVKDWTSFWNFVWKDVTVWDWDWQVKTENFTFTVKEILDGIKGIIDEVIGELEKEANKILDPIIKSLNLNIQLPGLSCLNSIEEEINKLIKFDLTKIEKFEKSLINLTDFI
jgi:hypothetical protein